MRSKDKKCDLPDDDNEEVLLLDLLNLCRNVCLVGLGVKLDESDFAE